MSRKNYTPRAPRINIDSLPVQYYNDPEHPEIYKIIDLDLKTVFVNVSGDYDGIIKLAPRRW